MTITRIHNSQPYELNVTNQPKLLLQKNTSAGLIKIWQSENIRWLDINEIEQTRLDIERPDQLVSSLHHYLLTALLFNNTPKTVLLGGLGGGALARFLHNKQPEIQGTAIEIEETIASIARDYFYFPKSQWAIRVADLRDWTDGNYEYMIIDIAENDLTPSWLHSEKMLLQFKQQLSTNGVLVINLLLTDAESFRQTLEVTRKIFERRTLCVNVPDHKNIVLFAFNQQPEYSSTTALKERAENLADSWGLDFSMVLEQLYKDNPKNSGII